jgi:hydrogenase-4 component F
MLSQSPPTATAMGVSLAALAGLPPSPLFLSELLILIGGFAAGDGIVSVIAAVALALGFLGLLHALIEGVVGDRERRHRHSRSEHMTVALTGALGAGLLALTVAGLELPGSRLVSVLTKGAL